MGKSRDISNSSCLTCRKGKGKEGGGGGGVRMVLSDNISINQMDSC